LSRYLTLKNVSGHDLDQSIRYTRFPIGLGCLLEPNNAIAMGPDPLRMGAAGCAAPGARGLWEGGPLPRNVTLRRRISTVCFLGRPEWDRLRRSLKSRRVSFVLMDALMYSPSPWLYCYCNGLLCIAGTQRTHQAYNRQRYSITGNRTLRHQRQVRLTHGLDQHHQSYHVSFLKLFS